MKLKLLPLLLSLLSVFATAQESQPIIDIHLHSYEGLPPSMQAIWAAEAEAQALLSPESAEQHFQMVLEEIEKNNIKLALVSSTSIEPLHKWKKANPKLFLSGIQTDGEGRPILSPDSLESSFKKGEVDMLGELGLQYFGIEPNDSLLEPYYQIAEENGIPVCLHTGLGPPGAPHSMAPEFRTTLGKPSLFEEVLIRHPNLKAFIGHAGYPYISETIAMMYIYPDLYADIGVLCWALPKAEFYSYLKQLVQAGFGKRIMFGTDQMLWPGAISIGVKQLMEAPFLSAEEKSDILYNNAARFLELSAETIQSHHQ